MTGAAAGRRAGNSSPTPASRRPIVGVMGSGADEHRELAEPLGRLIASSGYHLLTGGGPGVMTSVSRAFFETPSRQGLVLAIVPGRVEPSEGDRARYRPKPGYPNPFVQIPIRTHLWPPAGQEAGAGSRNHLNVLTADALVVLPGGPGTASELRLARRYGTPVIAFVPEAEALAGLAGSEVPWTREVSEVEAFLRQALGET